MSELIAEQLGNDLSTLPQYEIYYGESDRGEIHIYLNSDLYLDDLTQIQNDILSQGVVLTEPIVQVARMLVIKFEKRLAPLLIIALAVGGLVAGITGWQIWKTTTMGVPIWIWLIGGGALLYLFFFSDTGKQIAGTTAQTVKVYLTRGTRGTVKRKRKS